MKTFFRITILVALFGIFMLGIAADPETSSFLLTKGGALAAMFALIYLAPRFVRKDKIISAYLEDCEKHCNR